MLKTSTLSFLFLFIQTAFSQMISYSNYSSTCAYKSCNVGEEECTSVSLVMAIPSKKQNVSKLINEIYKSKIQIEKEQFHFICQQLFQEFETYEKEFKEFVSDETPHPFYREIIISISQVKFSFATIIHQEYAYTGGAHPNSFRNFYTIDVENEKLLSFEDVFESRAESQVIALIEKHIKIKHDIAPEESLLDAGFFEQKLSKPSNFTFNSDGVKFLYNPYEVAPYVIGYVEVTVPYSALEGLIVASIEKKLNP